MLLQQHIKQKFLEELYASYKNCILCPLSKERTQIVPGRGNPTASLMFIGEGPGKEEDIKGEPFVGRSGKLLNKIFQELNIAENDFYITNIVKCRPPDNKTPTSSESLICTKHLLVKEIEIINPKVICTLGSTASQFFTPKKTRLEELKKTTLSYHNAIVIVAYHPAYILRNFKKYSLLLDDIKKAFDLSKNQNRN